MPDGAAPAPENDLGPGVRALDHTADVGFDVRAASLAELFDRSASGMMALFYEADAAAAGASGEAYTGRDEGAPASRPPVARRLALDATDATDLLAGWLRELLYLHEVHGFVYDAAEFSVLEEGRLRARVRGRLQNADQVRELKGVTYHALEVARQGGVWRARVIFDV